MIGPKRARVTEGSTLVGADPQRRALVRTQVGDDRAHGGALLEHPPGLLLRDPRPGAAQAGELGVAPLLVEALSERLHVAGDSAAAERHEERQPRAWRGAARLVDCEPHPGGRAEPLRRDEDPLAAEDEREGLVELRLDERGRPARRQPADLDAADEDAFGNQIGLWRPRRGRDRRGRRGGGRAGGRPGRDRKLREARRGDDGSGEQARGCAREHTKDDGDPTPHRRQCREKPC